MVISTARVCKLHTLAWRRVGSVQLSGVSHDFRASLPGVSLSSASLSIHIWDWLDTEQGEWPYPCDWTARLTAGKSTSATALWRGATVKQETDQQLKPGRIPRGWGCHLHHITHCSAPVLQSIAYSRAYYASLYGRPDLTLTALVSQMTALLWHRNPDLAVHSTETKDIKLLKIYRCSFCVYAHAND